MTSGIRRYLRAGAAAVMASALMGTAAPSFGSSQGQAAQAQQSEFVRYSNPKIGIAFTYPRGMEVYDYGLYNEVNASYESGMIIGVEAFHAAGDLPVGDESTVLFWYTPRTNSTMERRLQLGLDMLKNYQKGIESVDAFGSVVEIKDSEITRDKGKILFQRFFINRNIPGIEAVWQSPTERFFHFYLISNEKDISKRMEKYLRTIEEFI
ncbi:MAG: hypothetical protein HYW26_01170 [Candidatus Aenigmarchaeota archaeon]|nr:hypothetical protein [Candidatus Aenigmarchaeota archaeon]